MPDKLAVIISSNDEGKARTGLAYAANALKNDWVSDIEMFIFGPAEKLVTENKELQSIVREFKLSEGKVLACKAIADKYNVAEQISDLGIDVQFIGKLVSDKIKEGYVPMIW